jgi:hypothetical protein
MYDGASEGEMSLAALDVMMVSSPLWVGKLVCLLGRVSERKGRRTDFEIKEVFVCLFGNGNVFAGICKGCRRFVPHRRIGGHIQLLVDQMKIAFAKWTDRFDKPAFASVAWFSVVQANADNGVASDWYWC